MTRINVPNQSMGYFAGFGAIPIFVACHLVVGDLIAMAVAAAFAIAIIIVVSSWALHSEPWFWPVIAISLTVTSIVHWWIAAPLSHLSEGLVLLVCIAGGLVEFLLILKIIELFEKCFLSK